MEERATKRIILLLTALVLCFCLPALAEEAAVQPDTQTQAAADAPPTAEDTPSEPLIITPISPDEAHPDTDVDTPSADESAQNPSAEADTPSADESAQNSSAEADTPVADESAQDPSAEADTPAADESAQDPSAEAETSPANEPAQQPDTDTAEPEAEDSQELPETNPPEQEPATNPEETAEETEEKEQQPENNADGHLDSHQVEERKQSQFYAAVGNTATHAVTVEYELYCVDCQRVIVENYRSVQAEEPHTWSDWEDCSDFSLPECQREQQLVRHCVYCGQTETATQPAPGHQWEAVSYQEATCSQDGEAVRRCRLCGAEEVIPLPSYGHSYVPAEGQEGGQYVCALCGEPQVKAEQKTKTHMYYNNTVTSFGPTTRELIGGSVWNRVTPVDLSKEGVFTYPLVASNMYTVGTATLVNDQNGQEVNYKLSSPQVNVHSESLVVYPDLEALKTGEKALSFDFNSPIDLKSRFGDDARVIVAITLKADYDADGAGVRNFKADQSLINEMMEMIK